MSATPWTMFSVLSLGVSEDRDVVIVFIINTTRIFYNLFPHVVSGSS